MSFWEWWCCSHPADWWAQKRDHKPLPEADRLLVCDLCRQAHRAGRNAALEDVAKIVEARIGNVGAAAEMLAAIRKLKEGGP